MQQHWTQKDGVTSHLKRHLLKVVPSKRISKHIIDCKMRQKLWTWNRLSKTAAR